MTVNFLVYHLVVIHCQRYGYIAYVVSVAAWIYDEYRVSLGEGYGGRRPSILSDKVERVVIGLFFILAYETVV